MFHEHYIPPRPKPRIMGMPPRLFYAGAGLLTSALLVLTILVIEANTYYIRDLWRLWVYNDQFIRAPCDEWPTMEEARRIVDSKEHIIQQIKNLDPEKTMVDVWDWANKWNCPGKGSLTIEAPGKFRQEIERLAGDKRHFYGVPMRLVNANWR